MADDPDLRIDTACKTAEEFTKLFFAAFDSKRHAMSRFYMDNATFSWDGNPALGKEATQKFIESLPSTSHSISTLDAQPVQIEAVKGQQTILLHSTGNVKIGKDKSPIGFTHSFVITAHDNKWKIFSNCCRLQLPLKAEAVQS